mmetsp:Transcript_10323/g.28073  ORF Transcript_10323/g.28073 Transcript_10323/m.28073 type:complete len:216 (-) Transcript_10323:251-898(-)
MAALSWAMRTFCFISAVISLKGRNPVTPSAPSRTPARLVFQTCPFTKTSFAWRALARSTLSCRLLPVLATRSSLGRPAALSALLSGAAATFLVLSEGRGDVSPDVGFSSDANASYVGGCAGGGAGAGTFDATAPAVWPVAPDASTPSASSASSASSPDNNTNSYSRNTSSSVDSSSILSNSISFIFLLRASSGLPFNRLSNIEYDASSSCSHFSR